MHHSILRILLVSNYLNVFGFALFGPLFTVFVLGFGSTPFQVSQLHGVHALTYGLGLLFFGRLQNNIRRKDIVVVVGFFALAVSAFLFLTIQSINTAFVVQIINAIASAWTLPAYKTLYAQAEDHGRETEEWAWIYGGNQILISAATILGGAILTIAGFRVLILMVGIFQTIGAFLSLRLIITAKRT